MRHLVTSMIGRVALWAAKLRGGGSAFPGLIVEKIDGKYLQRLLRDLPHGVVVVSGTNGKTTTTKMVVELLESRGLRVFTNKTGSNYSRGVIAAALGEINWRGDLQADVAVLELDEAHAKYFIAKVKPRHTLLLNVLRDQLDRFGELDTTAQLLRNIVEATTGSVTVDAHDPLLRKIGAEIREAGRVKVSEFGVTKSLAHLFPTDHELRAFGAALDSFQNDPAAEPNATLKSKAAKCKNAVVLLEIGEKVAYQISGQRYETPLKLNGLYNFFNAAAALTTARQVLADTDNEATPEELLTALAEILPAFGRGEQLLLDGVETELVLVKNPAAFRLVLTSFDSENTAKMFVINDEAADGRDMSWLWDVDFTGLRDGGVAVVSGLRCWDMALRLEHDEVVFDSVEPDLKRALQIFRSESKGQKRRIYCTYTAMLQMRRLLSEITDVKKVW
ncbi:MAG: DUF1727 domain-containing protein [Microbacteriaceae bacterium]|nr:DUF1727 domain-containing protein [Microbacteriaceae bacterium]